MKPCTVTLKEIKLLYSGEKLEAMIKAWEIYPTYKSDCAITRDLKKRAREARMNKILNYIAPLDSTKVHT